MRFSLNERRMMLKMLIVSSLIFFSVIAGAQVVDKIPRGTVLTCPKDNKPVMKVVKDISLFAEVTVDNFQFIEEYPSDIPKQIPCDVIKELCFHVDNKWIGFSKDCSLIPRNSGKHTFKEFISELRKFSSEREHILKQEFVCEEYGHADFQVCITKDKKWKCLKSAVYPAPTNIGPCTENK